MAFFSQCPSDPGPRFVRSHWRPPMLTTASQQWNHTTTSIMTIRRVVDGQAGLPSPNPTRSYWHTEPSSVLLGHRTTPELPATADIVVIGSGITGSFAAHFLKNGGAKNASVLMLEAREACWGATGRVSRPGSPCQRLHACAHCSRSLVADSERCVFCPSEWWSLPTSSLLFDPRGCKV